MKKIKITFLSIAFVAFLVTNFVLGITSDFSGNVDLNSVVSFSNANAEDDYGNGTWGDCFICPAFEVEIICWTCSNSLCNTQPCYPGWC